MSFVIFSATFSPAVLCCCNQCRIIHLILVKRLYHQHLELEIIMAVHIVISGQNFSGVCVWHCSLKVSKCAFFFVVEGWEGWAGGLVKLVHAPIRHQQLEILLSPFPLWKEGLFKLFFIPSFHPAEQLLFSLLITSWCLAFPRIN